MLIIHIYVNSLTNRIQPNYCQTYWIKEISLIDLSDPILMN